MLISTDNKHPSDNQQFSPVDDFQNDFFKFENELADEHANDMNGEQNVSADRKNEKGRNNAINSDNGLLLFFAFISMIRSTNCKFKYTYIFIFRTKRRRKQ